METNIPNPNINSKKLSFKQLIVMALVVSLAVGVTIAVMNYLRVPDTTNIVEAPTKIIEKNSKSWKMPKSNKKGYAFVPKDTSDLNIWGIEEKILEDTGIDVRYGGGAIGLGNSDPLTSPDLTHTAYIDETDLSLWIISHETLDKVQISPEGVEVSFITEWSPDGKYIVYHVDKKGLVFEGMGAYEGLVQFEEQVFTGFLAFNTDSGVTRLLSPIPYVETFVDDTRLLVRPAPESVEFVVFDIETFEADFDLVQDDYPFGTSQFDVSSDGENWTFTYSENPTDDAKVVYGPFPTDKDSMETLESGVWAEVQRPLISPDDTKLTYQKRVGYKFPGLPQQETHLVDLATGRDTVLTEGLVSTWLDNENLIIIRTMRDSSPTADVLMYNIPTGEEYLIGTEF